MGTVTTGLRDTPFGPANAAPLMDSLIAATGISLLYARQDHVHPIDSSRAPLDSPAFTGTPTAPTPAALDSSTKLATTAYADGAVATLSAAAAAALALKAPLASPTLTGTPVAPTAAVGTSTTQLATTAFVDAEAVAKAGDTMTGALTISAATASTTTGTGALIVAGGAGIGGSLNANLVNSTGGFFDSVGVHVAAHSGNYNILYSGNGTDQNTFLGNASDPTNYYRNTGHTFQSIAGAANFLDLRSALATCTPPLSILSTTASTSVSSGALVVAGGAGIAGTVTSAGVQITNTGGAGANLTYTGNGGTTPNKSIRSQGGNLEFVNSAYSVVIGTLTDGGQLTLTGGLLCTGINASGSIQGTGYVTRTGVSGSFGGSAFNMNWTGSATQLYIDNTNTGVITVTSDYRIKKDVTDAAPALAEVLQWRPITYTGKEWGIFKGNDAVRHSFVAHELQAISPDCVIGEKDGEQPQSLDLVPIIVRLAKAVQELSAELATIKAAAFAGRGR